MTSMTSLKVWLMWRGFHLRLVRSGVPVPPFRSFVARARFFADHAPMAGDGPGAEVSRAVAAAVHAAAELAEEEGALMRPEAVAAIRQPLLDTGAWLVKAGFAVWLFAARDPVDNLSHRDVDREVQALWGTGMQAETELRPDAVILRVKSCPFTEYFWNVARPDLAPLLCAWDAQWMAQVNAANRPVDVTRTRPIAAGGTSCDFQFRRTAATSRSRRLCFGCCSARNV